MVYNYNQATLVGRLTKDPELRSGADNFFALHFTIAVSRPYKSATGQTNTDFIPVVVRGKLAKIGHQLMKKGSPVLVWGRINVRQYDMNNETRWMTEISAENFQILERKSHKEIELNLSSDEKVNEQSDSSSIENTQWLKEPLKV